MTGEQIPSMAEKQMIALNRLLNALDNVPADKKENALTAAAEYLQKISVLRESGARPEDIEAMIKDEGERIRAQYN